MSGPSRGMITPTEVHQMRDWFASIEVDDVVLGPDVVAAVLGITGVQIKRRLRDGDLNDLNHDSRDAVKTLGRQVRNALKLHVFRTGQHVNSPKVL